MKQPPRRLLFDLAGLAALAAIAFILRAWVVAVYVIPSASMLPTLLAGDYLLVERWRQTLQHAVPARGDIVIFHGPGEDYAKRVIGLPGDRIAIADGKVAINGKPLPRWRVADLILPFGANNTCLATEDTDGCRYVRYREMLPEGRWLDTVDLGASAGDDMAEITVPGGRLFVLGDNRDRSADSRFPARKGVGTGFVPIDAVIGSAGAILLSVDGSARLAQPGTWWKALRPGRVGLRF